MRHLELKINSATSSRAESDHENICRRIELQDHAGGSAREARGPARAAAMLRLPAQAARRAGRSGAAFHLQPRGDLRRVALDSRPGPAAVSGTHRQRFRFHPASLRQGRRGGGEASVCGGQRAGFAGHRRNGNHRPGQERLSGGEGRRPGRQENEPAVPDRVAGGESNPHQHRHRPRRDLGRQRGGGAGGKSFRPRSWRQRP